MQTSSQTDCFVRTRLPLSLQSAQQRVWFLLSSIRTGLDACGESRTHAEGWVIEPRASELGKITHSPINNWSWKFVLRRARQTAEARILDSLLCRTLVVAVLLPRQADVSTAFRRGINLSNFLHIITGNAALLAVLLWGQPCDKAAEFTDLKAATITPLHTWKFCNCYDLTVFIGISYRWIQTEKI